MVCCFSLSYHLLCVLMITPPISNFKPLRMTEDHKPSREDEQKRIRDAGGFVINNRVMGELAVSRAFGDAEFKKGIQSIIDEEGVKMPSDKEKDGEGDGQKNWDQPLIIAKPDVEVPIERCRLLDILNESHCFCCLFLHS